MAATKPYCRPIFVKRILKISLCQYLLVPYNNCNTAFTVIYMIITSNGWDIHYENF